MGIPLPFINGGLAAWADGMDREQIYRDMLVLIREVVVYFRRRLNLLTDQQLEWLRDLAGVCGFRAIFDPSNWLAPTNSTR